MNIFHCRFQKTTINGGETSIDKNINRTGNDHLPNDQYDKVKSFQELSDEISTNPKLKHMQPTPQPKNFDEIEY